MSVYILFSFVEFQRKKVLQFGNTCMQMAVESQVVTASGFGPEDPGSIPDATKDPPNAYSARARKILCFESPVIGR